MFLASAIVGLNVFSPSVFGQKPKDEIIVMLPLNVVSEQRSKTYENIIRDLDRMFSTPVRIYDPAAVEEIELTVARHTIEDSPVRFFDFGLNFRELTKLRGGFEIGGKGFYLKSGLSWHPRDNKNITWTLGKKEGLWWNYRFHNRHDLTREVLQRPVERFMYVLENPFRLLRPFSADR